MDKAIAFWGNAVFDVLLTFSITVEPRGVISGASEGQLDDISLDIGKISSISWLHEYSWRLMNKLRRNIRRAHPPLERDEHFLFRLQNFSH